MPTTQPSLESLPVEIIRRIASSLPCESVLDLLIVSRRMRKICDDELVFKAIIKNGNEKTGVSGMNGLVISPWNLALSVSSSTLDYAAAAATWPRFALADSRARDWMLKLQSTESLDLFKTTDNLAQWLLQIVAFHHPLIAEADLLRLILALDAELGSAQNASAHRIITLGIIAAILQQGVFIPKEEWPLWDIGSGIYNRHTLSVDIFDGMHAKFIIFARAIVNHCQKNSPKVLHPSPEKIPFATLMELPLPFSSIPSFDAIYLPTITSASFLEDGEWVGYYSLNMDLDGPNTPFDPPMQGICFSATVPETPVLGTMALEASGFDSVGSFVLKGTIHEKGFAAFTKTYAAGFSWDWEAWMTPLGIVGEWGKYGMQHGHVWLWKREWCRTRSPQA